MVGASWLSGGGAARHRLRGHGGFGGHDLRRFLTDPAFSSPRRAASRCRTTLPTANNATSAATTRPMNSAVDIGTTSVKLLFDGVALAATGATAAVAA